MTRAEISLASAIRHALVRSLLVLAAAGGLAVAGPAQAMAAEAGVGVNQADAVQIGAVRSLGAHWVRMFVSWRTLQPTPAPVATSALASFEALFSELPAGTKVILDVVDSPQWETGSGDEHAPPARPRDYATFVASLAARWGTRVAAYEIWNEEDEPRWWTGAPDPAGYAALLKATYPAIKAADPSATVVLGGLTGNDYSFLEGVYQAGGKGSFDAVGVHTDTACNVLSPYDFLRGTDDRMIPDSFLAYREVHAVMLANGDDKPIWMTEASWRTTGAVCAEGAWAGTKPQGVSDQTQATYLTQAYHCLAQAPYVQVALWFPVQDEGPVVSGLLRADGSHKPSYNAMRDYIRKGDTLTEPCGVFTGPRITVLSPANRVSYSGPLPIHVYAASSLGVFRITLKIDGRLIRNYGGASYPSTLSGYLDWQGAKHIPPGRHTLTFIAYDQERNVSETSITIYHGGATSQPRPASRRGKPQKHKRARTRHGHTRRARHRSRG
jgi:Cellulase (glycosyl hydrolase family 5)